MTEKEQLQAQLLGTHGLRAVGNRHSGRPGEHTALAILVSDTRRRVYRLRVSASVRGFTPAWYRAVLAALESGRKPSPDGNWSRYEDYAPRAQ